MKTIKFNEQQIDVPTNWSEVLLVDYENWYTLKPETHLEHVQYVADICKVDVKQLQECPTKVFEAIKSTIQFTLQSDFEPVHSIDIEGKKYFIAPSDKLTLGEWVDVDAVLNSDDEPHKLSQLLSILCRPVGEKYDIEIAAQRVEMFENMPCDKVLPLVSFFCTKTKN